MTRRVTRYLGRQSHVYAVLHERDHSIHHNRYRRRHSRQMNRVDMLLQCILLLSQFLPLLTNYYYYSTVDKLTGETYDCISSYLRPDFFEKTRQQAPIKRQQSIDQITAYCLVVANLTDNEDMCALNNGVSWSLKQLRELNIVSNDLQQWNAHVDILDVYEFYLQTDDIVSAMHRFCNCSDQFRFGRHCQYTFDFKQRSFDAVLETHFLNLQRIVHTATISIDVITACYRRSASCHGGCLDWSQICNGINDCNDSSDEILCELLEFNECRDDEYRCRSGHCIPLSFAFDTIADCADATDEQEPLRFVLTAQICYLKVPNTYCDEVNDAWMKYPCGDGLSNYGLFDACDNGRHIAVLKDLYDNDNTSCFQHMLCTQKSITAFPIWFDIDELCGEHDDYALSLSSVCSESTVIFPPKPIMFSPSVYFVHRTNQTEHSTPDLICYTQCDHRYPPTSKHRGLSCRSTKELRSRPYSLPFSLIFFTQRILHLFSGCVSDTEKVNSSSVFRCSSMGKTISRHRIKDGFDDCHFDSDETFHGNTCIPHSNQQFQCWTNSNECVHSRFRMDRKIDCTDQSDEYNEDACATEPGLLCDHRRGLYRPPIISYSFRVI